MRPARLFVALATALVVARPGTATAGPPPLPLAPTPSPSPSPPAPDLLLVAIDSNRDGTVIERRANRVHGWSLTLPPALNNLEQWEPVCVTPCQVHLDPNGVYSVSGGTVPPSGNFTLPRGQDPLHLHVHAGSRFLRDSGIFMVGLGATAIVLSAVVFGNVPGQVDASKAVQGGLTVGVSGMVLLLVGTVLWLSNGSSVVTEDGRSL